MFKTLLGFAALLLVATAIDAASEPPAKPASDVHEGTVMAVTQDTLMLMDDRDNELETFAVTAGTKITFNGKPSALDEIQMGDRATVTGQIVNERMIALTIAAVRPK
jgi:hypothetical protein